MNEFFTQCGVHYNEYFLVGSRALDTVNDRISNDDSDFDYIVNIRNLGAVCKYLAACGIPVQYSPYNNGIKFIFNNFQINIIPVCDIEIRTWRTALFMMKAMIAADKSYAIVLKNKITRCGVYETLRGIVKTTLIPQLG